MSATNTRNVLEVSPSKRTLIKRATWLAYFTIGYNLIEGLVSIGLGISEESMALAGFGADSLIEVGSAFLVLWRFRGEAGGEPGVSVKQERQATMGIGVLFVLLAILTALASGIQLFAGRHPQTTFPGIVISIISLSFMFFLWRSKRDIARKLDSATVMKDADCSLACIKLSVVLFVGSLLFMLVPALWWADAVAALVLACLIGQEGRETILAARQPDFSGGCGCSNSL